MAEISTQVANRVQWNRFVQSSVSVNQADVEAELDQKYSSYDSYIDGLFAALPEVLMARLEAMTVEMSQTELELTEEMADDGRARDRRDAQVGELRDRMYKGRGAVQTAFDEEAADEYGLASTPPSAPDDLLTFARNSMHLLEKNPRVEQDIFGNTVDTQKIVGALQSACDSLEQALQSVDEETRQAHAARAKRDATVERWEQTYRGTAQVLSGLYLLAGRPDLAERVRPTMRSSQGKAEPPEAGDAPATGDDVVEPVEA
ncbi:hypothetical protein FIV42_03625 [Persicimonas caeni]|uniref:Uncharacterized protein n=1 Tax=Persicimonas caeni TaxID=2292766 RepID=A0A4Y6PNN4_PERCE|nr:hypothetical protein [Persicimonas caeni]QDG49860.1 hypothetical protein FIV42_03625 [Persicimonas caeni]QED31081.1 hypothetical protein FRD00_03620 [Persicimonas caeni]